jgi:hypothetical protein
MKNKKNDVGECASSWRTRIYIWNSFLTKIKPTKFAIFFLFATNFQLKLWDLYLPKGTILIADVFTTNTTFQALQDRIPFGRFGDTCVFFGGTPWNRPTGITTFFAITQEGVDQSFSSLNSTEISIRRFYVQNFITTGLTFEELSC